MTGKIFNRNHFEEKIKRIQHIEYFQDNFPSLQDNFQIRTVMQHKEKSWSILDWETKGR